MVPRAVCHRITIVVLLGLLPAAACAPPGPDTGGGGGGEQPGDQAVPIVGGTKASAYPEAVLIDMKRRGRWEDVCTGAVIAPRVVLTAGHCVYGYEAWKVKAPFVSSRWLRSETAATFDYASFEDTVPGDMHDVALVFLDEPIELDTYPSVARSKVATGSEVVNVGRVKGGWASDTTLYASKKLRVRSATSSGYPYAYETSEVIEGGDSGGPDFLAGTHKIVAVNSAAVDGVEFLARVDTLASWIDQQIAVQGAGRAGTCDHGVCAQGGKLDASCDPCVASVCAADAYCCSDGWDETCVGEAASICGVDACLADADCHGTTYEGACDGDIVVWCELGGLRSYACSAGKCGYDDASGYYDCL
jgi:V8-like Glu-specific endopeptidase